MKLKFCDDELFFKPCNGQMIYKDGTTEQIFACRELSNQCEVRTQSDQYIYVPYVISTPSGYLIGDYYFARFDFGLNEYVVVDTVKEFQIMKEN